MLKTKFIQIIFILFLLFPAASSSAQERNIELYFFYSPLCSVCDQTETSLRELKAKYSQLQIKKFEISKKDNQKIYSALAEIYRIKSSSVPGIFIEEKGFNYYSSNTMSEIEKILIRCARQECVSPTQKLLANSLKKEILPTKSNLNIIYIFASLLILGFILIKIFFTKRKN